MYLLKNKTIYILFVFLPIHLLHSGWFPLASLDKETLYSYAKTPALYTAFGTLGLGVGYYGYNKFNTFLERRALHKKFATWIQDCNQLPKMKITSSDNFEDELIKPKDALKLINYKDIDALLKWIFETTVQDSRFKNSKNWVNRSMPKNFMKTLNNSESAPFNPYVQRFVINPGPQIFNKGDLHGDVHSLNAFLNDLAGKGYMEKDNPFKIKKNQKDGCYIVFHGDYTDKGWYGLETTAAICYLKCMNPDNVFLVRGNHEDLTVNSDGCNGFAKELTDQFEHYDARSIFEKTKDTLLRRVPKPTTHGLLDKIDKFYNCLPLALFFGVHNLTKNKTNYSLYCHGGIEVGFSPHELYEQNAQFITIAELNPKAFIGAIELSQFTQANDSIKTVQDLEKNFESVVEEEWLAHKLNAIKADVFNHKNELVTRRRIGFQWNDFLVDPQHEKNFFVKSSRGRGWCLGKTFTAAALAIYSTENHKVRGIVRAHQHSEKACKPGTDSNTCQYKDNPMMCHILNVHKHDYGEYNGISRLWRPDDLPNGFDAHRLWNNFVYTLNVSPNTPYQMAGFEDDTYGALKTAAKFKDWRFNAHHIYNELNA